MGKARRDGTGSLRRRTPGGTWYARGYDANGVPFEISTETTDERQAQKFLNKKLVEADAGRMVRSDRGRWTFAWARDLLVNDYRLRERASTTLVAQKIAKHLAPVFGGPSGHRRLATITRADWTAYQVQRQGEGAQNATINHEGAALRRMFKLAVQHGYQGPVPYIDTTLPELNARRGFFEYPDFAAIRAQLDPWNQVVADLAYCTGWRVTAELLTLEWADIDRDQMVITLPATRSKTRQPRLFFYGQDGVVLLPHLAEAIDQAWAGRARLQAIGVVSPYVCTRWDAERVRARRGQRIKSWRGAWELACEAAGHPDRLVHDFRRTAIRNLTRAGVSEQIAMEMVGHKTREIFRRYNITHQRDLQDAAAKLGERLRAEIGRSYGKAYGKVTRMAQSGTDGRAKRIAVTIKNNKG